jgi:hypothetical protein
MPNRHIFAAGFCARAGRAIIALCSAKICIAQAIDLYSGKSRRQREQRDGLQLNAALRVAS